MIKNINFILGCIFVTSILFAQNKATNKYVYCQKIDKEYKIVFLKKDKMFNLFSNPRIVHKNEIMEIEDFDENNFTGKQIKIAMNKKYLVMDYITKGYVYTEKDSILHENYSCIILDIKKAKIVMQLQSDCSGEWNENNDFISDDKIIFTGKD